MDGGRQLDDFHWNPEATMKKAFTLLLFVMLPGPVSAQPKQNPQPKPLVFTHVTVIDSTGAPAKPDMTGVITGERIIALGKSGKLCIPANAQVVDATGKYMIQGLWDTHVHIFNYLNNRSGEPAGRGHNRERACYTTTE
jgi:hypothetical protein